MYLPPFVSEFPDIVVTDCVPAAGLMGVNKITHGKYPADTNERERLQNAMGTQNMGANSDDLVRGVVKEYGLVISKGSDWPSLAAELHKTNVGVAIGGKYDQLPMAIRNHSRQPSFTGYHYMYAQADNPTIDTIILGDPLAGSYYYGGHVNDLKTYFSKLPMFNKFVEEELTFIRYDVNVMAGTYTLWNVERYTHKLINPRKATFSRTSHAPVSHGSPGFWMISAGTYTGKYAVFGSSGLPFSISAVYKKSDGTYTTKSMTPST